jgi:hypothetical protein
VNFMAIVDRRHIISTVLFIFIFNRILNLSFVYFYLFIIFLTHFKACQCILICLCCSDVGVIWNSSCCLCS